MLKLTEKSPKGIATFIKETPKEVNSFSPDNIDVLISNPDSKKSFLGRIPLDHIVDCAVNNGFETEDRSITLTQSKCREIDHLSWGVLTKKYRLIPNQFIL